VKPVSVEKIALVFKGNMGKIRKLMLEIIENWPAARTCSCKDILNGARF